MTRVRRSLLFVVSGVAVVTGRARAAEPRLLVAVEVAPGVDVAPADVREAVSHELGTPVVGSREPTAAEASGVLVVGLDSRELRMSLRAGAAPPVTRTIATPADRPGRLRSIGWLAGNLVRDQVGPLVAAAPDRSAPAGTRPPTEPPALQPTGSAEPGVPAAVVSSRPSSRDDWLPHSTWAVVAGGGPAVSFHSIGQGDYTDKQAGGFTNHYHLDVQRQATPDSLLFGASLEVGPNGGYQRYIGASGFVGTGWNGRHWFLEGSLGAGAELLNEVKTSATVWTSPSGVVTGDSTTTQDSVPALFLVAQGTAGVRVASRLDVVARLGVHLSSAFGWGSFVTPTVGLRFRLP